jgi:hypothetical protein
VQRVALIFQKASCRFELLMTDVHVEFDALADVDVLLLLHLSTEHLRSGRQDVSLLLSSWGEQSPNRRFWLAHGFADTDVGVTLVLELLGPLDVGLLKLRSRDRRRVTELRLSHAEAISDLLVSQALFAEILDRALERASTLERGLSGAPRIAARLPLDAVVLCSFFFGLVRPDSSTVILDVVVLIGGQASSPILRCSMMRFDTRIAS